MSVAGDRRLLLLRTSLLVGVVSRVLAVGNNYSWQASPWGPCLGGNCGWDGWQVRNAFCFDQSNWVVAESFCGKLAKPPTKQSCFKMCPGFHRDLHWRPSKWSTCKPLTSKQQNGNGTQTSCSSLQRGTQQRLVKCVWKNSRRKLDPTACPPPIPPSIRSCLLPCPQDCVATEFQDWLTTCDSCGEAQRIRIRTVVVAPKYGGRKCPPMTESQVCPLRTDCSTPQGNRVGSVNHLKLEVSQWGPCEPQEEKRVRNTRDHSEEVSQRLNTHLGKRKRKLSCLSTVGKQLDLKMCLGDSLDAQMPLEEICILPRSCIITSWSEWSAAVESCVHDNQTLQLGKRSRKRDVLQLPMGSGKLCPPAEDLVDETPQTAAEETTLKLCQKYAWYAGDWSTCKKIVEDSFEQDSTCGSGIKSRVIFCAVAHSKPPKPVSDPLCSSLDRPKEIEPCPLACKSNVCRTSMWSDWSECQLTLDLAKEVRIRSRAVISATDADQCPSLDQFQYCTVTAKCTVANQTQCVLSNSADKCGVGLKTKIFSCIQSGKTVKTVETDSCHIPCQNDCILSEWSEWSQCSLTCKSESSPLGSQTRYRVVLSSTSDGGNCEAIGPAIESRKCADSPVCDTYGIFIGRWLACKNGTTTRLLHCLKNYLDEVDMIHCKHLNYSQLPITSKNCIDAQPCQMSDFTDWIVDENNCRLKTRMQLALSPSENCENIVETAESEDLSNCTIPQLAWLAREWSDCNSPSFCGKGIAIRDVSCVSDDNYLLLTVCLSLLNQPPPKSTQLCTVECDSGCSVSQWSEWSNCTRCSDSPVRSRSKSLLGSSRFREVCAHLSSVETEGCECDTYKVEVMGDWTPCVLNSHLLCGDGFRYRNVKCVTGGVTVVPSELCHVYAGVQNSSCTVECPPDCIWSPWSECSLKCGVGTRHRRQIDRTIGPSPSCDYEAEEENCFNDCSQYKWQLTSVESCKTDELKLCGVGKRSVQQRCFDSVNMESVGDGLCDPLDVPMSNLTCYIPCSGECVLSEWSLREPCTCLSTKSSRTRSVARLSAPGFTPCEEFPLSETKNCAEVCGATHWELSEWSNCQSVAVSNYHLCPYSLTGLRSRRQLCVRDLDGRVMDHSHCLKTTFDPKTLQENCCVFPDVNCIVSEWSSWSSTCHPCDKGVKERYRRVKQTNVGSGSICPPLREVSVCPYQPGAMWKADKWGRCDTLGADCGYGLRERNVSCVTTTGETADFHLCSHMAKPKMRSTCLVSCLTTCMYTDWSEWSRCHRHCEESQITHAYQSRSKVLITRQHPSQQCQDLHLETQNCPADLTCMTFTWVNFNGSRLCQRSDGLVVVGGCEESQIDCVQQCDWPNSQCSRGICICADGFHPVFNGRGELKSCEPPSYQQLMNDRIHLAEVVDFDNPKLKEEGTSLPPSTHWIFASITAVVALCAVVFLSTWLWYNKRLARVNQIR